MPTSEAPVNLNEPKGTNGAGGEERPELPDSGNGTRPGDAPAARSTSRWVDYDTHELLEMISELEDERRWARLREGVLWAILVHILLIFAVLLLPKYIPGLVPAIQTSKIQEHKDFTYLDTPTLPRPKAVKPLAHPPQIDRKTLEDLKRQETQAPKPAAPPPPPPEQAKIEPTPQPAPIPPKPQSQSPVEAPRPAAVPAKPNFAQLEKSQNPADQLQDAMRNAARNRGGINAGPQPEDHLSMHPGAGTGGLQILSDTQGVDFSSWLAAWHYETERTWDPLIPDEVNPPILKSGMVAIRFKVLPNGRLMDGSLVLEGRSGDVALDRAAWGALTGSNYPPLPRAFHGPYLELRAWFLYNMQPPQ
jgi:outer membrane biosynthesis protein TonB